MLVLNVFKLISIFKERKKTKELWKESNLAKLSFCYKKLHAYFNIGLSSVRNDSRIIFHLQLLVKLLLQPIRY